MHNGVPSYQKKVDMYQNKLAEVCQEVMLLGKLTKEWFPFPPDTARNVKIMIQDAFDKAYKGGKE